MDLFLAHAYQDETFAKGLGESLGALGVVIGEPLSLWPGQRLLFPIDLRLHRSGKVIVIVSRAFLAFWWPRRELDGLATRPNVIAVLSDVGEVDVSDHSPRLAVAAFPLPRADRLVLLLRDEDSP